MPEHSPHQLATGRSLPAERSPLLSSFSRRQFLLRAGVVVAGAGVFIACDIPTTSTVPAANLTIYYRDKSGTYHAQQVSQLKATGYRMLTLSVYGSPPNQVYAATWIKSDGPDWVATQDATFQQWSNFVAAQAQNGYQPALVTVTGTAGNAVYAGICMKTTAVPFYHFELPLGPAQNGSGMPTTFEDTTPWALKNGYILQSLALFGTWTNPLYAGIWAPNPDHVAWGVSGIGESFSSVDQIQQLMNLQAEVVARTSIIPTLYDPTNPSVVQYLAVCRDDTMGNTVAQAGLTGSQLDSAIATWEAKKYYPVYINGTKINTGTTFSAIFATAYWPSAVSFAKAYPQLFANPVEMLLDRMKYLNAHAGSLAIARQGKLLYADGFTWAGQDYPATLPTSFFRVASLSKPLTGYAIHQLIADGKLSLGDHMQDILHLKTPTGGAPIDPRFADITVEDLLLHLGGWTRTWKDSMGNTQNYDPMGDNSIYMAFSPATLPVTKAKIASFMANRMLDFPPGGPVPAGADNYSNFGYCLLGLIIEAVTNKTYEQYVKDILFTPLGMNKSQIGHSLYEQRMADEVHYPVTTGDPSAIANPLTTSVMTLNPTEVIQSYGGYNHEVGDSAGGWILSAPDYARWVSFAYSGNNNPLNTNNPSLEMRRRGWDFVAGSPDGTIFANKNGGLIGISTEVWHSSDDITIVMFLNSSQPSPFIPNAPQPEDIHQRYRDAVAAMKKRVKDGLDQWPTQDFFPQYIS